MPVWLKLWVFEKLLCMFGIDNSNFLYFFNINSTCPSLFFNSLGSVNNFTAFVLLFYRVRFIHWLGGIIVFVLDLSVTASFPLLTVIIPFLHRLDINKKTPHLRGLYSCISLLDYLFNEKCALNCLALDVSIKSTVNQ